AGMPRKRTNPRPRSSSSRTLASSRENVGRGKSSRPKCGQSRLRRRRPSRAASSSAPADAGTGRIHSVDRAMSVPSHASDPAIGSALSVLNISPLSRGPSWSGSEELADDPEEFVQAILVQPVPRPVNAHDSRVAKGCGAAIVGRVAGFAFLAVQKKGRAVDPRPQLLDVPGAHVVRGPGTHVVVELPAIGAVLVLVDALGGEVPRLLGGEMGVLLLHAAEGVLDRRVAPRQAAGEAALLADPLVHALGDRLVAAVGQHARRRTEPLDGREPGHRLRIHAGIAESDVAAE